MTPERNNRTPSFKFENLRLYYKALDFANDIMTITSHCTEDLHLTQLFTDEALNIVTTIADGSSEGKNKFILRLQETKTAIRKCTVYATLAAKRNLIDTEQENSIRNELMELTKMVAALLSSLQRQEIPQEENVEF